MKPIEAPPNPHPEDPYWAARILHRQLQRRDPKWRVFFHMLLALVVGCTWGVLHDLDLPHPPGWVAVLIIAILFAAALKGAMKSEMGHPVSWKHYSLFLLGLMFIVLLHHLWNHLISLDGSLILLGLIMFAFFLVDVLWPENEEQEKEKALHCPACGVELPPGELPWCLKCRVPLRLPADELDEGVPDDVYVIRHRIYSMIFWSSIAATLIGVSVTAFFVNYHPEYDLDSKQWILAFLCAAILMVLVSAALISNCPACGGRLRRGRSEGRVTVQCTKCDIMLRP